MDFLDDLDKAFDNMLAPEGAETFEPHQETTDQGMFDVSDLRNELTRQQLAPIAVLAKNMTCFRRRYLLAALAGGVAHLSRVDSHPERLDLISRLAELLRTQKGSIRKVLPADQRDALQEILARICDHFGALSDHDASDLLLALQKANIPLDTVYTLFERGISCPQMISRAPDHDIAHITHLDQASIAEVKALFAGAA